MSDIVHDYKTTPFHHQKIEHEVSWDHPARGHLWEMGTGKSKVNVDTAASLYLAGKIDAIFIVAPSGVHSNWTINELPTHLLDSIMEKTMMLSYSSEKAANKGHQKAVEQLMQWKGFTVLAMSYDALVTDRGAKVAREFLKSRRCLYIADEARRIKTPSADRTKYVLKSGLLAPYRRLLNGTPVPNGPFDLYSQMLFLDADFWKPLGISTFSAFKSFFGVFITGYVNTPQGIREFPQLVSYKNLDILQKQLDRLCKRVVKEDVLNLPPKLYSRRTFELNAMQKEVYRQLEDDFVAFLGDKGDMVQAPLALTRLLRLQQVTSGYVPVQTIITNPLIQVDEQPIFDLGKSNPRLDMLYEIVEDLPHKAIIWCRFRRTIEKVMEMAAKMKIAAVRYDGTVNEADREIAMQKFQKGTMDEAKLFVANAQTAGEGLTLHRAKTVIYVENTYDLAARLQSEDRAHRIGQDASVDYIDLVAAGTVDEHVTDALQKKLDIAALITGDRRRDFAGRAA